MNKDMLYKKIMKGINESLSEMELEPAKKQLKFSDNAYVINVTCWDKATASVLDKMSNVQVTQFKSGMKVYCPDWKEVLNVLTVINENNCFEKKSFVNTTYAYVTISKFNGGINDSLEENAMNEGEVVVDKKVFKTDYTFSQYSVDTLNFHALNDYQVAQQSCRWLEKRGFTVDYEQHRDFTRAIITYTDDQYPLLFLWVSYIIGCSDTINNRCPVDLRDEVADHIADGWGIREGR